MLVAGLSYGTQVGLLGVMTVLRSKICHYHAMLLPLKVRPCGWKPINFSLAGFLIISMIHKLQRMRMMMTRAK